MPGVGDGAEARPQKTRPVVTPAAGQVRIHPNAMMARSFQFTAFRLPARQCGRASDSESVSGSERVSDSERVCDSEELPVHGVQVACQTVWESVRQCERGVEEGGMGTPTTALQEYLAPKKRVGGHPGCLRAGAFFSL